MRRIALPMVGGTISTIVLTLFVIPAIYYLWVERSLPAHPQTAAGDFDALPAKPQGDTA